MLLERFLRNLALFPRTLVKPAIQVVTVRKALLEAFLALLAGTSHYSTPQSHLTASCALETHFPSLAHRPAQNAVPINLREKALRRATLAYRPHSASASSSVTLMLPKFLLWVAGLFR